MSLPTPDETTRVTLIVPATADSLAVVRTIIAGVGARADLTLDDIDDAMIAAEEVTLALLGNGAGEVTIAVDVGVGRIGVTASSDGDPTGWIPDEIEAGIGWKILTGVAEEAGLGPAGAAPTVWFRKRSAAR